MKIVKVVIALMKDNTRVHTDKEIAKIADVRAGIIAIGCLYSDNWILLFDVGL